MGTHNYSTTLVVEGSAATVFNAICNVRGWWSEEIDGNTDQLNAIWNYHYQDVHRCTIKITELVPNSRIVWKVLDNYFSFTADKSEWINNQLIFDITESEGKTTLTFTQLGLVPEYECFDICENAWNTYIHESLMALITTGIGKPNGKENPQTADEKILSTQNFTTTFFVSQTPLEVFTAINNPRNWWQGEFDGITDQLNAEFIYKMGDVHYSKQRVSELIPNQKVVWDVTDSNLSFVDLKTEWTGTKIVFEITEINNKTQIRFTHFGLVPTFQCYEGCSNAWEQLIHKSLVSLITTGKGVEVF